MSRYIGDSAEDDIGWALIFLFVILFLTITTWTGVKDQREHKRFFQEHQCLFHHSEWTGQLVYAGKGQPRHAVQVDVYQCKDGVFTEVQ
jgi:hypothetical protein